MRRRAIYAALSIAVISIIALQAGAYAEFQRLFLHPPTISHDSRTHDSGSTTNRSKSDTTYIQVDTVINYGNGTITWANNTKIPNGWNFYNLTVLLTNGNVRTDNYTFVGVQEHQILEINGVPQTSTLYWSLWKFCPTHNAWDWSDVGADEIAMSNGGIYGWYFQNYNSQNAPVPGAATVEVLDVNSC